MMKTNDPKDNIGLGYSVVNKLIQRNPSLRSIQEDLEGEAMVSLCECCKDYDPTRSDRMGFSTYTVHTIHNKLLNFVSRNEYRFGKLYPLEDTVAEEDEEGNTLCWEEMVEGEVVDVEQTLSRMPHDLKDFFITTQSTTNVREARGELGISWSKFYLKKQQLKDFLKESIISR